MRINKFVAHATGVSRRAADQLIQRGRITVNQQPAQMGQDVGPEDQVSLAGEILELPEHSRTVLLNKPVGYVCSRKGQGSLTIYQLLPTELQRLKPVGRLDKDSSGLLLLTNDGDLANQLAHPSHKKEKVYRVQLKQPLSSTDQRRLTNGVPLGDGPSHLQLNSLDKPGLLWQVTMQEGRNRQIRRSFEAVGNQVVTLERLSFGPYKLNDTPVGGWREL